MSFTDLFATGSDENLEDRTGWTQVSGAAGGIFARAATSTARAVATSSYTITNQGSSDFVVEITFNSTAAANNDCYVTMAFQDDDNFVAFQITGSGSTGAKLLVRLAGVDQTPKIETTATIGAIYRIEKSGTTWTLQVDTVPTGGNQTISDFSTESDIGLTAKGASNNNWVGRLFAEAVSSGIEVTGATANYNYSGITGDIELTGEIIVTGGTANYDYDGISGTIDLTGEVIVTGQTANYNYTGVDGTIELGAEIIVTGQTANYDYLGIDGTVELTGSITVTGQTANYDYDGIAADIILQGSIIVTGSTANYDYNALNGTIILQGPITLNPRNVIRVKRKSNTIRIKRKSNIVRVR